MAKIEIEGEKYTVTESLGFQGGYHAKFVKTPDGERVAVKRGVRWIWWTARDKIGRRSHYVGMSNTEDRRERSELS